MQKRLYILCYLLLTSNLLFSQEDRYKQPSRDLQRQERGLSNLTTVFIPKGQWMVGGTASYSYHENKDYNLVLASGINSMGYTLKVSPMFAYHFANNSAVGGRISYKRNLIRLYESDIKFGEEDSGGVNLEIDDYYGLTHSYSIMATFRQYIPIGQNKRFALFNEIQLEGGWSQSKFSFDSPIQGTYAKSQEYALNLSPGVTAFATNKIAIEVNVGVLGLSISRTKQVHNQVTVGETKTNIANFKVNIFSIGFGVAFYI